MMAWMTARPFDVPLDGDPTPVVAFGATGMDGETGGAAAAGPLAVVITGEDWLDKICPFLRARDGSWRSASPAREHRCWATDPPSELPVLAQQRLCLVREHDGCERFLHARELRSASLARDRPGGASSRAVGVPHGQAVRRTGRRPSSTTAIAVAARILAGPRLTVAAVAVMVVAVVVVLLLGAGRSGGPTPTGGSMFSLRPDGTVPSPAALEASAAADGFRRYRVRPGDTLRTIAERFGVSVRQLRAVNDLGDPPRLQPGDIILVPLPA